MPKDPKTGKRLRDKLGDVVPYANETPEEAQQAAASEEGMVDKVEDALADIQEPEMPETPEDESPEADEGLLMQLFKVVYREDFDPADAEHMSQLENIKGTLADNPDMVQALESGEMSMTDFALRVFKSIEPPEGGLAGVDPSIPEPKSSYFA
tara:strand:+ start:2346 stop:2804 length:459 start_codon:yes stop_codon:yes gene_type:complete